MLRALLFGVLAQTSVALKFCANGVLPSGSCPENAQQMCAENSGLFCIKAGLQYVIGDTSGCEKFLSGTLSGNCFQNGNGDVESDTSAPSCNPLVRTYCECAVCTQDSDCSTIGGVGAGCDGAPAGSGDFYAAGFADGKECGINHCADALKATYEELGACAP